MKKFKFSLIAIAFIGIGLAACDDASTATPTSDQVQRQAQEQLSAESNAQVGMPAITTFAEKRWMKLILEKRDDAKLSTVAYVLDREGKFHKVCNSLGYGLPYSTQYTNPQRPIQYTGSIHGDIAVAVVPQADPNGLFSPPQADGTWIMCVNPETKSVDVEYVEDKVNVFTFKPANAVD